MDKPMKNERVDEELEKLFEYLDMWAVDNEAFMDELEAARRIKQLLAQKQVVTRSDLQCWATELQNKAEARPRKAERVLDEIFKELDIEVVK